MYVTMAIDPGGTTGIAIKTPNGYHTSVCKTDEELWELFVSPPSLVIIEWFSAELISKYGLSTVELVGGVKALCWSKNIPLIRHVPQERIAFIKPAKEILKALGYRREIHEVDALAHLLSWEYWSERKPQKYYYEVREFNTGSTSQIIIHN